MAIGFNQQSWSGGGAPDIAGAARLAQLNRNDSNAQMGQGMRMLGGGIGGAMAGGKAGKAGGASVLGGKDSALKGMISGVSAEANPQFAEDAKEVKALRTLVEKYGTQMGDPDAKNRAQMLGLGELRGVVQGFALKQAAQQMKLREQEAKMRQQAMKAEADLRQQQQMTAQRFNQALQGAGPDLTPQDAMSRLIRDPIALGDPRAKDLFNMLAASQGKAPKREPELITLGDKEYVWSPDTGVVMNHSEGKLAPAFTDPNQSPAGKVPTPEGFAWVWDGNKWRMQSKAADPFGFLQIGQSQGAASQKPSSKATPKVNENDPLGLF